MFLLKPGQKKEVHTLAYYLPGSVAFKLNKVLPGRDNLPVPSLFKCFLLQLFQHKHIAVIQCKPLPRNNRNRPAAVQQIFISGVPFVPLGERHRINTALPSVVGVLVIFLGKMHGIHGSADHGTLGHDNGLGQHHLHPATGNQPRRVGFHAEGMLRQNSPSICQNFVLQGLIRFGINDIQTRRHDGNRLSARIKAAAMSGRIAPLGQSADNDMSSTTYLLGHAACRSQSIPICSTGAYDYHIVFSVQQFPISQHMDERRCIISQTAEMARIFIGIIRNGLDAGFRLPFQYISGLVQFAARFLGNLPQITVCLNISRHLLRDSSLQLQSQQFIYMRHGCQPLCHSFLMLLLQFIHLVYPFIHFSK